MAKTKTPFLSLGAHGSIGNLLTSQKRGSETLLRTKPTPAYRQTLPQLYQRWDYQDYAYQWTLLTPAQKQTWHSAASRYHMTGLAYWIQNRLTTLPNLAGRWRLDTITAGITPDSSKNTNHGIIFGAQITDGLIGKALHFDGNDDYVNLGHSPTIDLMNKWTMMFFLNIHDFTIGGRPWGKAFSGSNFINISIFPSGRVALMSYTAGDYQIYIYSIILIQNTWHHFAITYDYPNQKCSYYIDAVLQGTDTSFLQPNTSSSDLVLGCLSLGDIPAHCVIDNFILENRILDLTEIKRHSERRYPA